MELGQENTIRTNYLRIGGEKALNGGAMRFRSGLTNPTFKPSRGQTASSRMPLLTMGDNWDTATGVKSTGVLDLSGGTVDGLIETMHVARTFNNGGSTTSSGSGDGTLTFTAGTIDATTVYLGCQGRNNLGVGTGLINVRDSAVLVVGTLNIGGDRGSAFGTGTGTLNIADGGQATVTGNVTEYNAGSANGTSTINITNGTLTVAGLVRVDNLTADNAALNLTVGPTINAANPVCDVTNLTLLTSVTLNVSGTSLTLARYPLIKYQGSIGGGGYGVVTLGTQPAQTLGYLTNNTVTSSIDLVVTNVPAVKWNGNVNGNWDINTTLNWINSLTSAATTYQESTIPGDPVIFDDTASARRR